MYSVDVGQSSFSRGVSFCSRAYRYRRCQQLSLMTVCTHWSSL